jgi:hypothetical protein
MALWPEILRHAAEGDAATAREVLNRQLPLALRGFVPSAEGSRKYQGPVPEAVARYIGKLPAVESALARFHEYDLVDYIVDDVVAAVERTLVLVELCRARPNATVDELAASFPWDKGLKRDSEWKKQRVVKNLRSIRAAGIPLTCDAMNELGDEGEEVYTFNEEGYAASTRRVEQSWWDFKRQQNLDAYYLSIVDSDSSTGVSSEAVDFGSVGIAKVVLGSEPGLDQETVLDLHFLGESLGPELTEIMETIHREKPKDGFRPIAWHNVFWCLSSDYEGLHMGLRVQDPFCERDQELSDYLADNYRDVASTSRPVIYRRRRALHEKCEEKVLARIKEKFARRTKSPPDHNIG